MGKMTSVGWFVSTLEDAAPQRTFRPCFQAGKKGPFPGAFVSCLHPFP